MWKFLVLLIFLVALGIGLGYLTTEIRYFGLGVIGIGSLISYLALTWDIHYIDIYKLLSVVVCWIGFIIGLIWGAFN